MGTLTEGRHPVEFILSEANGSRSRGVANLIANQSIAPGAMIDQQPVIPEVVATAAADEGNAGNATIAMDQTTPINTAVKEGRYVGIASAATKVDWTWPDGTSLGESTHGSSFTGGGLKFKITAGNTATEVDDRFYIDVVIKTFEHLERAHDSVLDVAGIAMYPATTGAGETGGVAMITRDAEVNGHCIVWPAGMTAGEKAALSHKLAARGIVIRA
jgi:hypothetical protein